MSAVLTAAAFVAMAAKAAVMAFILFGKGDPADKYPQFVLAAAISAAVVVLAVFAGMTITPYVWAAILVIDLVSVRWRRQAMLRHEAGLRARADAEAAAVLTDIDRQWIAEHQRLATGKDT